MPPFQWGGGLSQQMEEQWAVFSGPELMDAGAVSGIQLSTRGIRAHVSTSTAIAEVGKVR